VNNPELSDVTIYAGNQKFPAHRFILSARSSVFEAMLNLDFKEKKENSVTVEESAEVFKQILEYIYSGQIPTSECITVELFTAADKVGNYQVFCASYKVFNSSMDCKNFN
jgi:speckle-type POZ protein